MQNNKKTLAGLVLGALLWLMAPAAWAQFDYTLYGVADFSYGRFEPSGTIHRNRWNSNSLIRATPSPAS